MVVFMEAEEPADPGSENEQSNLLQPVQSNLLFHFFKKQLIVCEVVALYSEIMSKNNAS